MVVPSTLEEVGEPDCGPQAPLCFSPDGALFLTTNIQGHLFLWDMAWIRHEVARLKLDWRFPPLEASHAPLIEQVLVPPGGLPK